MKRITVTTLDGDLELDLDQQAAQRFVNGVEAAFSFLTNYGRPPGANRPNGWPVFVTPEGDIRIEDPSRLGSRRLTVDQADQLLRGCLRISGVASYMGDIDMVAVHAALAPPPVLMPDTAPMPEIVTVTVATTGGPVRLEVTPAQLADLLTTARDAYESLPYAARQAMTVARIHLGSEAV